MLFKSLVPLALLALIAPARADITIHTDQPGPAVSPTLYGAFFEDINRAGDGGIYAEMLQNRSFEDANVPLAWTLLQQGDAIGDIALVKDPPINPKNLTQLKLNVRAATGRVGISNEGFKGTSLTGKAPTDAALRDWVTRSAAAAARSTDGLNIRDGKEYDLSVYLRAEGLTSLTATLEKQDGTLLATAHISDLSAAWKKFDLKLLARGTDTNARFTLSATNATGTVWIDMVSLFPKDTYNNRPNGLRPDLVQMMLNLHPGILRFPGGSFSEGAVLADAWRWKETIGDIAARGSNWNIWGYRTSNGLGFHEYLQMAEDVYAEPLFVAHVGMSEKGFVPLAELEPWIQDALDAIEYANGPVNSAWGAKRAAAGHPEPFHLKFVEIGNENGMGYSWGGGTRADYLPRYKAFYDRIHAAYPDILTIANIHTEPDVPAQIVDEHYYEASDWFFKNANLYDKYDRTKPKIYVGEYACKPDAGNGNLRAALAEAAFLTGIERNADVVTMTSYAPLFTTLPWQRWKPNAITFDNHRAFGSPSYYVQSLFGAHRPQMEFPVDLPAPAATGAPAVPTLFACAGRDVRGITNGGLILKVVNSAATPVTQTISLTKPLDLGQGECIVLTGNPADENSFAQPDKVAPKSTPLPASAIGQPHTFPPCSVTILRWWGI